MLLLSAALAHAESPAGWKPVWSDDKTVSPQRMTVDWVRVYQRP